MTFFIFSVYISFYTRIRVFHTCIICVEPFNTFMKLYIFIYLFIHDAFFPELKKSKNIPLRHYHISSPGMRPCIPLHTPCPRCKCYRIRIRWCNSFLKRYGQLDRVILVAHGVKLPLVSIF